MTLRPTTSVAPTGSVQPQTLPPTLKRHPELPYALMAGVFLAVAAVVVVAFVQSLTRFATALLRLLQAPTAFVPWVNAVLVALIVLGFIMVLVLFLIWFLRKFMGWIQVRLGPMRVGFKGMFQTPADAVKLLIKEDVIPAKADRWIFTVAPILVFVPAYMVYVVVPFGEGNSFIPKDLNIGVLYVLGITSIAVIGIILGGWASDNKYSMLGAMRSAAQMVSYEVPMVLAVIGPVLLAGSMSMQELVKAQQGWFWDWNVLRPWGIVGVVGYLIFLIASFAETNHTPFDLPEAESELVAGFNVEYSGMKFAMFFLAEFANTFTVNAIAVTLFWGGWSSPFGPFLAGGWWSVFWFLAKTSGFVCFFMWVRSTYPRVRVDQLMEFGWKVLIPLGLVYVLLVGAYVALGAGGA